VTIAKRPYCRGGTGRVGKDDLPDGQSGKFFVRELDTIIAGLPVGQITQVRYSPIPTKFRG
jgi:hypothetical protein